MSKSYTQLTENKRYQIYSLKSAGHTQTYIAQHTGVHKSTISRELKRNQGKRGYRPKQAHCFALQRRSQKVTQRITEYEWGRVEILLREDWSPEQVSNWLKNNEDINISTEWIYQYIYADKHSGGTLIQNLRCQKKRRKRYGSYDRRGQLNDRTSIEQRPAIVDQRMRIGDWEADTVTGQQTGPRLVTLVERKTRYTLVGLAKNKSSVSVSKTILAMTKGFESHIKTITYDNGKEFAEHKAIAKATSSQAYFAHPYQSWERGLNENTNGLLRQYFRKGEDFSRLSIVKIMEAADRLNNRPRKCLGFKTPNQVFLGINPPVALES